MRLALLALAGSLALGCTSFEGWRLYDSGTRALDRGDVPAALADLERAASLMPRASEVHNHLGIAYLDAGRDLEALASFRRAVRLDCDNRAARQNLEVLEARLGIEPTRSDAASDGRGGAPR